MRTGRGRLLLAALAAASLATASCAQLEKMSSLPKLKRADLEFAPAESSRIFASDGKLITTLHGIENRTVLRNIKDIPRSMQRAIVAIEDERFYEHNGVDFKAIIRAAVANVTSGRIAEGGSTITQQYVKQVIIAPGEIADETFQRKIDEAALARQIESKLSKKEILRRYLNTVYFGNGAYGIQAAATTYFGKDAKKLNARESATLAGLVKSPGTYDPFDHPRRATARRNLVLSKMAALGWLGPRKAERYGRQGLKLHAAKVLDEYKAPYFVDYVARLITFDPRFADLGRTWRRRQQLLFTGGLRIHTTVDLEAQAAAEQAIGRVLEYPSDPYGSLVAIDPNNGHVRALVGGRDYFAKKKRDPYAKLNLAIQAEPELGLVKDCGSDEINRCAPGSGRQAGSAFKPFALATAIEEGIPLSKTYKAPSQFVFPGGDNGDDYVVQNYEGAGYGKPMSLLEATVNSVNVVYAQLGEAVGATKIVENANEMGINTQVPAVLSTPLGTGAVNPLGMASAYGTFATNGVHHPPVAITKITDATGKVLYRDRSKPRQALSPGAAYITTTALEQVIQRGTAATYGQIGRPAAGKTGTAQEYRDAWFVGYTPDLVTSVWVGYPKGQIEMKPSCLVRFTPGPGGQREVCRPTRILVTGGSWPTLIWSNFMVRALSGVPASSFVRPAVGLTTVTIDSRNGCLADRFTPSEYQVSATFTAGTAPEKSCREPGDVVTIPDILGFPVADAVRVLHEQGLTVSQTRRATNDSPPDRIVGQSPAAGAKAVRGATVTIVVSKPGAQTATVPGVLGQTASAARATLQRAGLEVASVTQAESDGARAKKNRGRVWKQQPASGTSVAEGSTVTIFVNP